MTKTEKCLNCEKREAIWCSHCAGNVVKHAKETAKQSVFDDLESNDSAVGFISGYRTIKKKHLGVD